MLAQLAAETPAPGAGSVAALTSAMAAGLVAMVARNSRALWEDAPGAIAQADALRARLERLAEADADAYAAAFAALNLPDELETQTRNTLLASTLAHAAEVPLEIASAAADVAALAEDAATNGDPQIRADAAAAAVLAEAGARVAAYLVAVNLATSDEDERVRSANAAAAASADAARRALAAEA